jgi:hypothetical protein
MKGSVNKCQGRATGPCPYNKKDSSVVLCQGDLLLCKDCKVDRFSNENNKHVFHPLLTFAACCILHSPIDLIRKNIIGKFTLEDVLNAKDKLWEIGDSDILGDKLVRKASTSRSEADAHVSDILQGLSKLDKMDKLPSFAIDFKSLALLPALPHVSSDPVDVRLSNIELMCKNMQSSIDSLVAVNSSSGEKGMTYANALTSPNKKIIDNQVHTSTVQKVSSTSHMQMNVNNNSVTKERTSSAITPVVLAPTMPVTASNEYITPTYFKRKERKQALLGKGKSVSTLRGAPPPSRDMFVFRVDKMTSVNDLKDYIIGKGCEARDIIIVSHKDSHYKSFKVTVSVTDYNNLMKPEIWPEGIMVRQYRVRSNKAPHVNNL